MEKHLILSSFRAKRQANNYNQKANDFTIFLDPPLFLDPNKNYEMALDEIITMTYSSYNVSDSFNNNKIRYRKTNGSDTTFKNIELPNGMYSYSDIDAYLKNTTGKDGDKYPISVMFDLSLFRTIITIQPNYELDLSVSDFNLILGFKKKNLTSGSNISDTIPDLTRSVDLICIHCDLTNRSLTDESKDVLFCFSIIAQGIRRSFPFTLEPRRLKFSPINKNSIDSIRIYITDSYNRPIDLNEIDTAYHIIIKEVN